MSDLNLDLIRNVEPFLKLIREYHRHEVCGLDSIPKRGRALIVFNHSLATYDIALLIHAIYVNYGRLTRSLIDRLFYKVPYLSDFMESIGAIEATNENAADMLRQGNLVAVAPGGMREALRPSSQKYTLKWDKRLGFARLAIMTQSPVIIAVCPKADDLYKVYENPVTAWMYKKLKVPLFFARGLGPSPLPRPVKLTHYLSEPIKPPRQNPDPEKFIAQVERFHRKVIKRSEELMMEGTGQLLPDPNRFQNLSKSGKPEAEHQPIH